MATPLNILSLYPELTAIGREQMQLYCDEWVQRPIAKQFGIAQVVADDSLRLYISVVSIARFLDGHQIVLPIDELVDFVIDRHDFEPGARQALHKRVRETRDTWPELNPQYDVATSRIGRLHLTCKNPACGVLIETSHFAAEDDQINCPPCDLTCPACNQSHVYDGSDLKLNLDDA
jgi:hypothetical protein